ncbi:MAG: PA14 domain-containing protein [Chloroflexota bacterium]
MLKKLGIVFALLLTLLIPVSTLAQGPINPQHSDPYWRASYWNNMQLSGTPALVTTESNINFNWGTGSPYNEIQADQFSARWVRYIDVTPGTYRFTVTSDDGVRLWINDELILDAWHDRAAETDYVYHYLPAGHHLVRMEYYENTGLAVAQLSWVQAEPGAGRWRAEYFNNMTLSGTPALVRNEAQINFDWQTGSPAPGIIRADYFSARWTTTIDVAANMYTFRLTTDDGARFWVNGHLLIDAWYDQAATLYTASIYLGDGPATLEVQYYENIGLARIQLTSEPPMLGRPTGTAIIVDNQDAGFITGGSASSWRTANEGYNNQLLWTQNNDMVRADYNWARWYPNLTPGLYEVFVYIPNRFTTTAQARYWIAHEGGLSLQIVDQSMRGGQWVSLGTFRFRGDGSGYVSLADVTFEPRLTRLIAFDAVRWEPR